MKGNISLGDFIGSVKKELVEAQDESGNPFYELAEVQLEVSFVLDVSAKAGAKLIVLELGGESKAQQTHKVSLRLQPIPKATVVADGAASSSGGPVRAKSSGGGGVGSVGRPKYR